MNATTRPCPDGYRACDVQDHYDDIGEHVVGRVAVVDLTARCEGPFADWDCGHGARLGGIVVASLAAFAAGLAGGWALCRLLGGAP